MGYVYCLQILDIFPEIICDACETANYCKLQFHGHRLYFRKKIQLLLAA